MKTKEEILDRNGFDYAAFEFENEYSAKNLLNAMEEYANQSKWISVKDELPEIKKSVLIIMKFDELPFVGFLRENGMWCAPMPERGEVKGDGYYDGDFKDKPDWGVEVIAWQPLPTAPQSSVDNS